MALTINCVFYFSMPVIVLGAQIEQDTDSALKRQSLTNMCPLYNIAVFVLVLLLLFFIFNDYYT